MSMLTFTTSGLTLDDIRSIAGSSRCKVLGTHPKTSDSWCDKSSTLGTWTETEVRGNDSLQTYHGERIFQAGTQILRIVYECQTREAVAGVPGTQTLWAAVSVLNKHGLPEPNNLTVYCQTNGGGSALYYGPGDAVEATTDWVVTIKEMRGFWNKDWSLKGGLDDNMAEALNDLVANGHTHAVEQGLELPDFAQHGEVRDAIAHAASRASGLYSRLSRLRAEQPQESQGFELAFRPKD